MQTEHINISKRYNQFVFQGKKAFDPAWNSPDDIPSLDFLNPP